MKAVMERVEKVLRNSAGCQKVITLITFRQSVNSYNQSAFSRAFSIREKCFS